MSERPLRLCDICGGLDDHPRHVFAVAPDDANVPPPEYTEQADVTGAPLKAVAQLLNPGTKIRHMDCCAEAGCVLCQATEAELGGVRGQELIDALLGGALDGFVAPTESEPSNG